MLICKLCGMESATTDRCSHCGQPLAAATPEAPSPPVSEATVAAEGINSASAGPVPSADRPVPSADRPPAPAPSAQVAAPKPAPTKPAPTKPAPTKLGGARPPAPAMMPKVSDRVRRGPETVQPIPQWVPWERAPLVDAARPINLTGEALVEEQVEPSHVSLSDPLAEHMIYMQNAPQNRQAPALSADAASVAPVPPAIPTSAPTVASVSPTAASPAAAETPTSDQPATRSTGRTKKKDKDIRPDLRAPILPTAQLGRYAGAFALVLLVAGALAYIGPNYSAVPLVIALFIGALLLPVLRLVPWQDEDSDDVLYFILLTLMFGPVVSLVIYGILGALRQTVNPAIAGCMTVAALTRLVVDFAARAYPPAQILSQTMPFTHLAQIDFALVKTLLKDWSGMIALAGWYFANVFHKFDE